jgi:hypothetical protein
VFPPLQAPITLLECLICKGLPFPGGQSPSSYTLYTPAWMDGIKHSAALAAIGVRWGGKTLPTRIPPFDQFGVVVSGTPTFKLATFGGMGPKSLKRFSLPRSTSIQAVWAFTSPTVAVRGIK